MMQGPVAAGADKAGAPAAMGGGGGAVLEKGSAMAPPKRCWLRAWFSFLSWPMFWGMAITAAVLGAAAFLGSLPVMDADGSRIAASKLAYLPGAPPGEVGDTLAGIAGVLAFVWIIVAVWLQATELAEQRKELRAQRQEMQDQRKATEAMARAMEAQAAIFEEERKYRSEARTAEEFGALIGAEVARVANCKTGPRDHTNEYPCNWFPTIPIRDVGSVRFFDSPRKMPPLNRETFWNISNQLIRNPGTVEALVTRYGVGRPGAGAISTLMRAPKGPRIGNQIATFDVIAVAGPALSEVEPKRPAGCRLDAAIAALASALAADIRAPEETAA